MVTIYLAGGEDSEFTAFGGGTVTTTAGRFRSSMARCALLVSDNLNARNLQWWRNTVAFTASDVWCSFQASGTGVYQPSLNQKSITLQDSSGIERLRIRCSVSSSTTAICEKVDASGTATQLGSAFSFVLPATSGVFSQVTIHVNYSVSGSIDLYVNGALLFSYSGDVTTNSITSLSYLALYNAGGSNGGNYNSLYSELIISDTDNRSWNLQTFAPVANGNTHNFDTGTPAAANVNQTVNTDSAFDGSTTAGQIDQYTNPAVAAGSYGVVAFGVSGRLAKGLSGPAKMDLGVRTAGTDYWSADQTLSVGLSDYQNWWVNNPNTGVPWLTSEIGSTAGFNIGLKSVT